MPKRMIHTWIWNTVPDPHKITQATNRMMEVVSENRFLIAGPNGEGIAQTYRVTIEDPGMSLEFDVLEFNGVGPRGHEPFLWPGRLPGEDLGDGDEVSDGRNAVDTRGDLYDPVVRRCLEIFPDELTVLYDSVPVHVYGHLNAEGVNEFETLPDDFPNNVIVCYKETTR